MSPRPSRKARSWCIPPIPRPPRRRNWQSSTRCFPKIKTTYLRLQAGALYAKLLSERQGNVLPRRHRPALRHGLRARFPEARRLHAVRLAGDGGLQAGIQSSPEGYWTWGALVMAAIAYNPNLVSAEEAPKTWQDLLDPKWTDAITVKVSILRPAARRVVCAAPALRQRLLAAACAAEAARLRLLRPAVRPAGERPGQGRADRAVLRLPDR